MNDWIIWGILVLVICEIIFIFLRIVDSNGPWIIHKIISIFASIMIGTLHLIIITENTLIGEAFIFHWDRLLYELYVILAIVALFIINYFVKEFMIKFAIGGKSE